MQLDARADAFFRPYHQAITDAIEARQYGTRCPAVPQLHRCRWLAQRYGIDVGLDVFGKGERVPYADLLEEIITLVPEDAQGLDCVAEVE